MLNKSLLITALVASLLGACSKVESPAAPQQQASTAAPAQSQAMRANEGRVISSINVAGYTYIEAENNGQTIWLAGTPIKVSAGDMISWGQGSVMSNFHSKSLDRTFERIIFVSGFNKLGGDNAELAANQAKVISVQNQAGYSYIEAKTADNQIKWIAVPTSNVKADDIISWNNATLMTNFNSPSLNKTFPEILFAGGIQVIK